jgi:hypothetical protein
MPFEVQRRDGDPAVGAVEYSLLRAYVLDQMGVFNPYGLRWQFVERRAAPFPGVRVVEYVYVGGIMWHEAEEATGLFDPACWDKILDEV